MKNKIGRLMTRRTISNIIIALCAVLFYVLLNNVPSIRAFFVRIYDIMAPFIWGVVLAYLLNPIVRLLEERVFRFKNRRVAHVLAVIFSMLLVLLVFGLIIGFLVPELSNSIAELIGNLEGYFNTAKKWLQDLCAHYPFLDFDVNELIGTWNSIFTKLVTLLGDNLSNIVNYSYKFGTGLFNVFIVVVMAIYIQLDRDNMVTGLRRVEKALLPDRHIASFDSFCQYCHRVILNFYGMNLLDAVIIGVANFILMTIFGMQYVLLISLVVGVTNFIPSVGPIIGAIPSALLLVIVNPWHALFFLIFTIVLQTLDAYVIKPLLFKDGTGLSSLEVLLSIVVFGKIAGIFGMLIGVPMFSILSMLGDRFIERRLQKKKQAAGEAAKESDEAAGTAGAISAADVPEGGQERPAAPSAGGEKRESPVPDRAGRLAGDG